MRRSPAGDDKAALGTLLLRAAEEGDAASLRDLVAKGADVNARDRKGWTPLIWRAYHGVHADLVSLLLKNGADVNAKSQRDTTALIEAVRARSTEIVRLLVASGADVNAANKSWESPVTLAATVGGVDILKLLIDAGADLKLPTNRDALIGAAARGNVDVVEILLARGADVDAKTPDGWTAQRIVESLLDANARNPRAAEPGESARFRAVASLLTKASAKDETQMLQTATTPMAIFYRALFKILARTGTTQDQEVVRKHFTPEMLYELGTAYCKALKQGTRESEFVENPYIPPPISTAALEAAKETICPEVKPHSR